MFGNYVGFFCNMTVGHILFTKHDFFLPIYESLLEKILVLGFRADLSIWYEFECDDDLLPAQFSSDREWGSLYNQKSLEIEEDKMIVGRRLTMSSITQSSFYRLPVVSRDDDEIQGDMLATQTSDMIFCLCWNLRLVIEY
jgi:hypothetical protein